MRAVLVSLLTFCVAGSVGCAKLLGIDDDYGERLAEAGDADDAGDSGDAGDRGDADDVGSDGEIEADGGPEGEDAGGDDGDAGSPSDAGDAGEPLGFNCGMLAGTVWSDHCYFVIAAGTGLSWSRAKTSCETFSNSHLVTITSAEEQAAVEAAPFPSTTDYWIGLSLQGASTQTPPGSCKTNPGSCPFRWVTGEALSYTKWMRRSGSDSEPNYSGACARIQLLTDKSWADFGCGVQVAAICEHD